MTAPGDHVRHHLGFARNGTTHITGGWWRAPWATGWERVPASDYSRDYYRRAVQCSLAGSPNAEEQWMCRQFGCPRKPRWWWRGRLAFALEQGCPVRVTRDQAEALIALHAAGWPDSTSSDHPLRGEATVEPVDGDQGG